MYDTDTAELVASVEQRGLFSEMESRNYLYKTKKGNFFRLDHETRTSPFNWGPKPDVITPLSIDEAKEWYEKMDSHSMDYKDAFGIELEEA